MNYAAESFPWQKQSYCHCNSVQLMVTLPNTTQDIGELDSVQCTKKESCVLLKIHANQ